MNRTERVSVPPPGRRVALVANAASGSQGANEAMDQLDAALAARGCIVSRHTPANGRSLDDAAAEAVRSAPAVVVALGGDGTVNTVAHALHGLPQAQRPALAILPQGTFNLVAKRYALPAEPEALAELIEAGVTRAVGAGEVNGRWFFNNCSFGLYTSMIDARERHKARFGRSRAVAIGSALATLLERHGRQAVRLDVQSPAAPPQRLRTSLVFIGANPLQLGELSETLQAEVDTGALAFVAVRGVGWRQLLRIVWGALLSKAADAQEVEACVFTAARIATRKRRLRCVIDGEIVTVTTPLVLRHEPEALRLCVASSPPDLPDAAA